MKKTVFLIVLYSLFGFIVQPQVIIDTPTIKNISAKRKIIIQSLIANKPDSLYLLETLSSNDYSFFTLREEEKLFLISGCFEEFIVLTNRNKKIKGRQKITGETYYKNDSIDHRFRFSANFNDLLEKKLDNYIKANEQSILQKVDRTNFKQENKDFVKLMLNYYLLISDFCNEQAGNDLLMNSRKFSKEYPKSSFLYLVNKHLNIKYKESNWGAGSYFNSGLAIPTGNLQSYFTNGVIINAGLTVNYRKIYFFAGFGPAVGGEIKKNLFYQKEWKKGDKFIYSSGELMLGYNLINRKKFGITTLFGTGGSGISPISKEDENYYVKVENITPSNSLIYGINFDYRGKRKDCRDLSINKSFDDDFSYIIARVGVFYSSPGYNESVSNLTGSMWYIKVGLGYQMQFKKRNKGNQRPEN